MRRIVDILLVLALLAAIGYFFLAQRDGLGALWFASPTPTALVLPGPAPTLPATATRAAGPSPTALILRTATLTVTPTRTQTPLPTVTATLLPSETSTAIALQSSLEDEINDGIERGNLIVQAIEAFASREARYPDGLDELIPAYITTLPSTGAGQPYFYRPFDAADPLAGEIYWLAFKVAGQDHVTCTYMRRLQYWDCNFASP